MTFYADFSLFFDKFSYIFEFIFLMKTSNFKRFILDKLLSLFRLFHTIGIKKIPIFLNRHDVLFSLPHDILDQSDDPLYKIFMLRYNKR